VTRVLAQTPAEYLTQHGQLRLAGGLSSFALGRNEQVKTWPTAYLGSHPGEAGARKVLGAIYLGERHYDSAIDMLEAARKVFAGDARLLSMLGSASMAQGKNAKAAEYLEQAAKLQDSPEIQTGLGLSLLDAGHEDGGFAALLRSYQADPVKSQALVIDLDHSEHKVHGQQPLAFYNGYYRSSMRSANHWARTPRCGCMRISAMVRVPGTSHSGWL
jgi:tetratricopeptide (TPR) repeat protein